MSKIYLGLAQWHHNQWYLAGSSAGKSLQTYASSFSSVEGNMSFYGLPSQTSIQSWDAATNSDFKFCFKFPKEISHKQGLTHCSRQVCEFLNRISILNSKLGIVWLQLDRYFGAINLPKLDAFLRDLPVEFDYAVEVRSIEFYLKDDTEKIFNQMLQKYNVNRVIFDTRSLFANDKIDDKATLHALSAKPRVPTHALSTSDNPFVRIIVPMDQSLGMQIMNQWAIKIASWLSAGLSPYVFFHTPDNAFAPQLAKKFTELLIAQHPQVPVLLLWQEEQELLPQVSLF
jgi:uncharacterized protein YecE (DUF72 family)